VTFRRLAHINHEKKKLLQKQAEERKASAVESGKTNRSWLGWSLSKSAVSGIAALDVDNIFTSNDMEEINGLIEEAARLREEAYT
jgi:hypothetical protein